MIDLLIAIALGGLLAMTGVVLGAFLMDRAVKRRESNQPLFGSVPQGDVFSIDDLPAGEPEEEMVMPETLLKQTEEFAEQFVQRLGGVQ
jgi:hypothetical protein